MLFAASAKTYYIWSRVFRSAAWVVQLLCTVRKMSRPFGANLPAVHPSVRPPICHNAQFMNSSSDIYRIKYRLKLLKFSFGILGQIWILTPRMTDWPTNELNNNFMEAFLLRSRSDIQEIPRVLWHRKSTQNSHLFGPILRRLTTFHTDIPQFFYVHVTVHRNKFLFNKTNRRANFPNLFCQETLQRNCPKHVEFLDKINLGN
jgi:hypothetical protein